MFCEELGRRLDKNKGERGMEGGRGKSAKGGGTTGKMQTEGKGARDFKEESRTGKRTKKRQEG